MRKKASLLDANALSRTILRIAHEIIEKNECVDDICIVGIKTRGVFLATRLADAIEKIEGKRVVVGSLDVSKFRDDINMFDNTEELRTAEFNFPITDKNIILADDVIYTGRTVRAALDAILSKGRASKIQLAALVDRGHRELPIRADYVGKNIPTSRNEIIKVNFTEHDGVDGVELYEK